MKQLKLYILTIVIFALSGISPVHAAFSDYKNEFAKQPEKLAKWNDMADEVAHWTDGLGMPIDPKIKETVITLNIMGFETFQSCEGHADRGLPHPWIHFNVYDEEFEELKKTACDISARMDDLTADGFDNLSEEQKQELRQLGSQNREVQSQIKWNVQNKLAGLYALLEKFYSGKKASFDRMICFPFNVFPRIQSQGGDWDSLRTPEEKASKLKEYQQEMSEFTDFLIEEYLQS